MPRVNSVVKARRDQGACASCRTQISKGDSYKHASKRTSPYSSYRMVWCSGCWPKPSQLASGHRADLYAVMEGAGACLAVPDLSIEGIVEALTEAANGITEVGEEYTQGADNMEEGFGHATSRSDEMRERGEELGEIANELEQAGSNLQELVTEFEELQTEQDNLIEGEHGFAVQDTARFEEIQGRLESIKEEGGDAAQTALGEVSF